MSMGINIRMQEHNVDGVKHTVIELLGSIGSLQVG
jgi:hypothetical protein